MLLMNGKKKGGSIQIYNFQEACLCKPYRVSNMHCEAEVQPVQFFKADLRRDEL